MDLLRKCIPKAVAGELRSMKRGLRGGNADLPSCFLSEALEVAV